MELLNETKKWSDNQESLSYLFLFVLIVPNIVLCFTEPLPLVTKVANVLLPLGCYHLVVTLFRNCEEMFWILLLFILFGVFQVVLFYLFGQPTVAVDMFLSLTTTNSSEAVELLDNLLLALIIIVMLCISALILGMTSIVRKRRLSTDFICRQWKHAWGISAVDFLSLGVAYLLDKKYEITTDLYPVNVCYNVVLAVKHNVQTLGCAETPEGFTFHVIATHPAGDREIYVLVVGEISCALNRPLYDYDHETNSKLSEIPNLTTFTNMLTQPNTAHKSVPILISAVSVKNFDSIYHQKGIITAFRGTGLKTAFSSNQRYNNSSTDSFGKEADHCDFIKEDSLTAGQNLSDDNLLASVKGGPAKGSHRQFIVLHTYDSHFNYRECYSVGIAFLRPDSPADVKFKYRDNLANVYDSSIRYTDNFLAGPIGLLQQQDAGAAMLYTSDHGEDIFDDDRHLFLHMSPVPSCYQLHVPFIVWTSDIYQEKYPRRITALQQNRQRSIASDRVVFYSVPDLAGVITAYVNNSLSVANPSYTGFPRFHLNGHSEPRAHDDIRLCKEDFEMLRKMNIRWKYI